MAKSIWTQIGTWAFIIGILVALVVGIYHGITNENYLNEEFKEDGRDQTKVDKAYEDRFFYTDTGATVAWVLVALGAVIGILSFFGKGTITGKEVPGFLFAGIGLVVMGGVFPVITLSYRLQPYIGSLLSGVSISMAIFVAPAVGIFAIKAIWDMGKDV